MSHAGNPDDELLVELRELLNEADPPPAEVSEFARAAIGWRRLDAELAELLSDSVLDSGSAALVRSGQSARAVVFRTRGLSIDLEIRPERDNVVLLGQIAPPPGEVTVELQRGDGSTAASGEADSHGRFRLELGPTTRVRLRIVLDPPSAPVETSWLSL